MSKNKVKKASSLFPVRKTLVAPILPEPILRISLFKKVLVRINPVGNDPNK